MKRVEISLVEVYENVGKSVISGLKSVQVLWFIHLLKTVNPPNSLQDLLTELNFYITYLLAGQYQIHILQNQIFHRTVDLPVQETDAERPLV